MSVEHVHTYRISAGGQTVSKRVSVTSGNAVVIDETIPGSSTDLAIALVIDVSQLKSIFIVTSTNMTLEFNDGTTPDKTLTMVADQPFEWTNLSQHANPFGVTDVDSLFVTKAGAGDGRLQMWVLTDPTV